MSVTPFHPAFEKRVINDPFLTKNLLDSLETTAPTTIRLNPFKPSNRFSDEKKIPWCKNAFTLTERPSFTLDPLFHAGAYYPQEAGSMLLDQVLRSLDLPTAPTLLDLCAAPGGKSTLIASFLNNEGLLVANEVIQMRSKILAENLTKWGVSNTVVTNSDPAEFKKLPHFFDCILVDAPCSGEGMFRRLPASRTEWSEDNVQLCSARQKRIVHDVYESLKPGGFLIYSTCTFNSLENEQNVQYLIDNLDFENCSLTDFPAKPGRDGIGYYALPNELNTEGFFLAVLRKKEDKIENSKRKTSTTFSTLRCSDEISSIFANPVDTLYQWKDALFYLPLEQADKMLHLQQTLRIVKMGIRLGEGTRKGLKWSEEIALSHLLRSDITSLDFTENEALKYLKCETFPIPKGEGMCLVKFDGFVLGAIKQIGTRFNTFWPKEWRIRQAID